MKVVTEAIPIIKLVPRFYPDLLDDLIFTLDDGLIIPIEWEIAKNTVVAIIGETVGFVQGTAYSFTITRSTDIVYKGKIIFVANDTDVQNYTNQSQNTRRWKQ
jgi:hypothetical protein